MPFRQISRHVGYWRVCTVLAREVVDAVLAPAYRSSTPELLEALKAWPATYYSSLRPAPDLLLLLLALSPPPPHTSAPPPTHLLACRCGQESGLDGRPSHSTGYPSPSPGEGSRSLEARAHLATNRLEATPDAFRDGAGHVGNGRLGTEEPY